MALDRGQPQRKKKRKANEDLSMICKNVFIVGERERQEKQQIGEEEAQPGSKSVERPAVEVKEEAAAGPCESVGEGVETKGEGEKGKRARPWGRGSTKHLRSRKQPGNVCKLYWALQLESVRDREGHDQCLLGHRNGLCIATLAPSHIALQSPTNDAITEVRFPSPLLNCKPPSGKKKSGAVHLSASSVLCSVVLSSGKVHEVCASVSGHVMEINKALTEDPSLLHLDPLGRGYIAILRPKDEMLVERIAQEKGQPEPTG